MITRLRMIGGPYDMHELPGGEGQPDIVRSFLRLPERRNYDYRLIMIVEENDRKIAVYVLSGYGCIVKPPFEIPCPLRYSDTENNNA